MELPTRIRGTDRGAAGTAGGWCAMSVAVVPGSVLGQEMTRSVLRETPGQPVTGVANVRAALTGLVRSARRELLSFDDPAGALGRGIAEPFLELACAGDRASGERTATVRRIAPRHSLVHIRDGARFPGDSRVTDTIPFKIIVADRAVAAVPLDLELHDNGVLLIRDPVVVQTLVRTSRLVGHRRGTDRASGARRSAGPFAAGTQGLARGTHRRGGRASAGYVRAHIQPARG